MNKKDLRFFIDQGRITIVIKAPDHQPPHVHVYRRSGEEDVILIKGEQERLNDPGYLTRSELRRCQKWILDNQAMLMKKWEELEQMGLIPKHEAIILIKSGQKGFKN